MSERKNQFRFFREETANTEVKSEENIYDVNRLLSDEFNDSDKEFIKKAYDFAQNSHKDQKRKSGEPYFVHVFETSLILKELKMCFITIASGLLHDTIEDVKNVTTETIKNKFGSEVARIVHGVTKIGHLKYTSQKERFNENLRKMILSMAKDIRVVIVKLADRLHNMRTLNYVPEEKQKRIAIETREIYAPLANRLGMYSIKSELEDLSMRYLEPKIYRELAQKVNKKKAERLKLVKEISHHLEKSLKEENIKNFLITGRSKHFYSIYRKIRKGYSFDEIYDLSAIRIVTKTVSDCYKILGVVHAMWSNLPHRFKDYIGAPKENGYQSLHTTVMSHTGELIEIQIRTQKMHEIAEEGIAAHWKYKEEYKGDGKELNYIEKNLRWIRRIKNWAQEMRSQKEDFVEDLKIDILGDQILCFTPMGKVVDLPRDATPVDFAFSIHTEIGKKCSGAKITRDNVKKIIPLSSVLQNFDVVEILTKTNGHPGKDWLKFVKTNRAKNKIKQWIRSTQYKENYERGKDIFIRALKDLSVPIDSTEAKELQKLLIKNRGGGDSEESLFVDLGFQRITGKELAKRIRLYSESLTKKKKSKKIKKNRFEEIVNIKGMKNVPVKMAKCCNPIIGDDIYGFITKLKGVSIHKSSCRNFLRLKQETEKNNETNRIVKAYWKQNNSMKPIRINIIMQNNDRALTEIYDKLRLNDVTVISVNTHNINNRKKRVELEIRNSLEADFSRKYLRILKGIKYVIKANLVS